MAHNDIDSLSLFDKKFEVVQSQMHGMTPSILFEEMQGHNRGMDRVHDSAMMAGSQLSQETGGIVSDCHPMEENNSNANLMQGTQAMHSTNKHVGMNALLQQTCGMLESNVSALNEFEVKFVSLISECCVKMFEKNINKAPNTAGEFVSFLPETGKKSKSIRKQSANDPRRWIAKSNDRPKMVTELSIAESTVEESQKK